MSKCNELRKLLLEWGEDNYLPLQEKIKYLENENYRLRTQNQRIHERNKRLSMIVKKRREERKQIMTGKEWSKLCKEHGVVVIDANYKNMTHEDAIKFFDLLETAMDHTFARKYDLETGQYEDYALPEGATYYEDDMNKKIACCECGKEITYGASYTSRIIQNKTGFGYAVCKECYYKNDMKEYVKKG